MTNFEECKKLHIVSNTYANFTLDELRRCKIAKYSSNMQMTSGEIQYSYKFSFGLVGFFNLIELLEHKGIIKDENL